MTGRVSRFHSLNQDAHYFVLCHELGHHVYSRAQEREADYFAARVCLPWFFESQSKRRILEAFERVHQFRESVWKKTGTRLEIHKIYACRKSVVQQGINQEKFKNCFI